MQRPNADKVKTGSPNATLRPNNVTSVFGIGSVNSGGDMARPAS
jgi:hypothetical protein